ncbi:MAG: hypothetical protein ACU84Q_06085 [Gammaproteobacteria bacterium]
MNRMTNNESDNAAKRRKKAVRTAAVLGALVIGYYIMFLLSHVK